MPTKGPVIALPRNLTHEHIRHEANQADIPRNAFSKKSQETGVLTMALVCGREAVGLFPGKLMT